MSRARSARSARRVVLRTVVATAHQAGRTQRQPVTYAATSLQIGDASGNPKQVTGLQSRHGRSRS